MKPLQKHINKDKYEFYVKTDDDAVVNEIKYQYNKQSPKQKIKVIKKNDNYYIYRKKVTE